MSGTQVVTLNKNINFMITSKNNAISCFESELSSSHGKCIKVGSDYS